MRVCIIRNAESRTNAAIFRVLDALLDSGYECHLLTRSRYKRGKGIVKKNHIHDKFIVDNYEINISSKQGRGLTNIFQLIYYQFIVLIWLLRNSSKYDIIHAFDLDSGLPVLIVNRILKKKYVYHIADFYVDSREGIPKFLKKLVRKLEYSVINNGEATIICTEEREEQIKGSRPEKLVTVHNVPYKVTDIEFNAEHRNKMVTFTYIGGLSEGRFIKDVIDTFIYYPSLKLELAGMGHLSDYARQASLDYDNISYYGMIEYDKALELYAKSDVMFAIYNPSIPNHKYSAPNKVYEAMLYGKPIIVARNTGIDKVVEKEGMGFVIDYNRKEFERILSQILNDRSILTKYGENALRANNKYSWNKMKNRLSKVYKELEE